MAAAERLALGRLAHHEQIIRLSRRPVGYCWLYVTGITGVDCFRPWRGSSFAVVGTAAISLFIIVILVPVLWHGPRRNRWLAMLLTIFPLIVFGFTTLVFLLWILNVY